MAGQVVALKEFLSGKALTVPDQKRFDRRRTFEGGPQKKTRPLAPVTIDSYLKQIRRAIRIHSELSSRSYDVIELFEMVDCDAAENILNRHAEELEKSGKGSRGIHLMACALLCLGRRYFNVPKDHEDTLHWLLEQVEVPEPKMTLKNVERLRALVISKQHQLLRLPGELIQYTLKRIKSGACQEKHLVDAQVAVAIAILLSIPMREKNLASIRLGVNLTLPTSNGTEGRVFLAADAVKSRVEVDRFIPADVSGLLRIYVRQVLPLIRSNPTSTALFPGRLNDSTRGPAHLGTQVSRRIAKHLGIEMNVHLFRHFAAVMYLEEHPGDYEVVRLLLGNRNLQIVKDFYTGVEQEAAFRKADAVMLTKKHLAGVNPLNMAEPLKRHSSRRRIRRFI